jgi:hypothetical protein
MKDSVGNDDIFCGCVIVVSCNTSKSSKWGRLNSFGQIEIKGQLIAARDRCRLSVTVDPVV